MKSNRILNIVIAAIAIIGAILFVRVFMEDKEVIETNVDVQNSIISPLISFSYWLLIAAVVIAIGLSLWAIVKNPENLKKMLMSLAILGILLLGYYVPHPEVAPLVNGVIGVMTAAVMAIIQFWFGSSSGSKDKDAAIAERTT